MRAVHGYQPRFFVTTVPGMMMAAAESPPNSLVKGISDEDMEALRKQLVAVRPFNDSTRPEHGSPTKLRRLVEKRRSGSLRRSPLNSPPVSARTSRTVDSPRSELGRVEETVSEEFISLTISSEELGNLASRDDSGAGDGTVSDEDNYDIIVISSSSSSTCSSLSKNSIE